MCLPRPTDPLSAILTGANRHDVTSAPGGLPLLDMELGWTPCRRCAVNGANPAAGPSPPAADTLTGPMTRGGIARNCRHAIRLRRTPAPARRGAEHGSGLGVHRWVVERTLGWRHQFRRLRVRYERRADIHEAFLSLGCSIICFRRLTSFC